MRLLPRLLPVCYTHGTTDAMYTCACSQDLNFQEQVEFPDSGLT
jgi:hypothetical protein